MAHLDVWFDLGSPFAWLAARRVVGLARAAGRELRLWPVPVGDLMRAMGRPAEPWDTMAPAKRAVVDADLRRRFAAAGFAAAGRAAPGLARIPAEAAMTALLAAPAERRVALWQTLFDAGWLGGADLDTLAGLAQVSPEAAAWATGADGASLRQGAVAQAIGAGVFGVPTVGADGWLAFGEDRLARAAARLGVRPVVEVFHDVASPYAYLGMVGVHRAAEADGFEVRPRPILLGALFKAIGTPIVPIATFSAARQAWTQRDLREQAEALGVAFQMPAAFPMRTVTAQRLLLAEPAAWRCVYDAAWARGLDVGDDGVLREALSEGGFDPAAVAAAAEQRERLANATAAAVAAGVCGAPTFRVGGELHWGQDRIDAVRAAARAVGFAG